MEAIDVKISHADHARRFVGIRKNICDRHLNPKIRLPSVKQP